MDLCRVETWTWILTACFTWMCISQAAARPQYMVAIPAVLEAGSEAKFCVDFLQLKETVNMTISLSGMMSPVFQETFDKPFHDCRFFQAPAVQWEEVQSLQVVVQGQTFQSNEERTIQFKPYKPMTFIQTDKPFYLPGQTVKFRVVTMDTKFKPVNERYDEVLIEDANGNRIGQWLTQSSNGTILQSSYSLNPEAHKGTYKVIVRIGDKKIDHSFKVDTYVLPKFDVNVKVREEISIEEDEFTVEVCATYTYGHPVPGKAEVELCRSLKRGIFIPISFPEGIPRMIAPCHKESKQTDKSGCAGFTFKMSTFTRRDQDVLEDRLHLNANVEEDGTGVIRPQGKVIDISYAIGELSFMDVTSKVHEGQSVVEGKVKARYLDDTSISGMLVYVFEESSGQPARNILNLTTDSDGVAAFSFNSLKREITLTASAQPELNRHPSARTSYYVERQHDLSLRRPAGSSLEVKKMEGTLLCRAENHITVHYTVAGETAGPVDLMYLILSKAAIIKQGWSTVQVLHSSVTEGEISLKLEVSPDMAPLLEVLAYAVLPSEKIIAHHAAFTTEKCFSNEVSLEFSPSTAIPGEQNTLRVSATPGSLCGVSAVDQSVLIKEPGKQLDAQKIFNLLPVMRGNIPFALNDGERCDVIDDDYEVFEDLGLKMATNLVKLCQDLLPKFTRGDDLLMVPGITHSYSPPGRGPGIWSSPLPPPIQTIRTFFPETWLWELVEMGDSGKENMALTVPDTITTWQTEAFCLSQTSGFGLAPPTELRAFKPFFVDLSLPYSIVRGESLVLKATVFNYQSSCIVVSVTPRPSSDYTLKPVADEEYSSCLCANGRKTFHWHLDVSVLGVVNVSVSAEAVTSHALCGGQTGQTVILPERGRIDEITRSLIVKAEGTEMIKTDSWLLCPKGGETLTKEIKLQLHDCVQDFVIWGSVRSSVSVLGDLLVLVMQNPSGLLRMPYGCGEQSMARLAPNIYTLEYLKNTNQLTPAVKDKVTRLLKRGFQKLQYFRNRDGSYVTFGRSEGNTWLTAFVLRSLAKAKSFVNVDHFKIVQSWDWVERKQKSNGCFKQSGKLLNNRQRGGVSDEVTLTAYIAAAFLESNVLPSNLVVKRSLSCLREAMDEAKRTNTYTTALMAYAFSLAGETETRAHLLQHLRNNSLQDGGLLHWSQTSEDTSASLSVEMSSYVLLALLTGSPTAEELSDAARIVRWLARQQNPYGGFKSTQDTVVAIQALSRYSTLTSSQQEGSSTVTIKSYSGWETFHVDQSNRLLYQERQLRDLCGKYILEVKGDACVSVQMSIKYNIATPAENSNLTVYVSTEASCSTSTQRPQMTLKLQSIYTGDKSPTNMVLVEVGMLSGFVPEPESWSKLKEQLGDRLTLKDNCVHIYFDELQKDMPVNHELKVIQEVAVQNLRPALVKIYDYYHPSEHSQTEYSYPCGLAQ